MARIVLLLLAGVIPALSQFHHIRRHYQQNRFTDYADYSSGRFSGEQRGSDFGLQQQSFFGASDASDAFGVSGSGQSVSGGGGLSAPGNYDSNGGRHAIVPSSLRELEESYIRSLSTSSTKQPYLDPYGENRPIVPHGLQGGGGGGVENYSGFPANRQQQHHFVRTHYNKNEHVAAPYTQQVKHHQQKQQQHRQRHSNNPQSAPLGYGFPVVNQQISATNSIEAQFGQREQINANGKFYDYPDAKNNIPNFPDFTGPPPIPEEPYIPPQSELERDESPNPNDGGLVGPTTSGDFGNKVSPPPLASPPPIFDPTFPEPIIQKGFIPSFGPPTKEPFNRHNSAANQPIIAEPEHNHLPPPQSEPDPVPLLRPEYPTSKAKAVLPDEVTSFVSEEEGEGPRKGKVYKHISVHVPAEDLEEEVSAPKLVKVTKKPEKHLKVIFIKPPAESVPKTELEVEPTPQQKTLVYLLSGSDGTRTPIKLVSPAPLKPTPPQVFFLRYKDPNLGAASQPPSVESERDDSSGSGGGGDDNRSEQPSANPEIRDLNSPLDPDAELLRSAPAPVIPTYSSFSSPGTTPVSQLALQTTLTTPAVFTTNFQSPTGSYQLGTTGLGPDNNQLTALQYNPANIVTTGFPTLPPQSTNPYPQNFYSSLFHLYPPPSLTSLPNHQNLLPAYYPALNQQFPHHQALTRSILPFFPADQSKVGPERQQASQLQGLYTVAPQFPNVQGINNLNSIVQSPDGKGPRNSRNPFVMMTYAPTYMPSASGSEQVPVFTSPADLIKSLLGDSYMYSNNNIGNNITAQLISSSTSTTSTIPPPPSSPRSPTTPNGVTFLTVNTTSPPQHHTIPLLANLESLQNLTRSSSDHLHLPEPQPYAYVLGSTYGANQNGKIHSPDNSLYAYSYFPSAYSSPSLHPPTTPPVRTTTTTPTRQPRISFQFITTRPIHPPVKTSKQIIQLPVIIYESNKAQTEDASPPSGNLTTAASVTSHLSKFLRNFNLSAHSVQTNDDEKEMAEEDLMEDGGGDPPDSAKESEDAESGEVAQIVSSSNESSSTSGEEEETLTVGAAQLFPNSNSSSLISASGNSAAAASASALGSKNVTETRSPAAKGKSRKRVNPALVKPGRRLRKVRKPPKKDKSGNSEEEAEEESKS